MVIYASFLLSMFFPITKFFLLSSVLSLFVHAGGRFVLGYILLALSCRL
jgi:hypothetical protein